MWPLDMTKLDPPPTAGALTAREQLELYTAMAQFRLSMVALGVYFVILVIFLAVVQYIAKDNQLTLAVLLLQPITLLIGGVGGFWLQRARSNATDTAAVTTTSTPGGGTTTTVGPPPVVTPPAPAVPAAAGGAPVAAIPPAGGEDGAGGPAARAGS